MKHLLTKNQKQRIEADTEFSIVDNSKFNLYELRYRKSQFKNLTFYLQIDSMIDDRPIYRQITDLNAHYNPDEKAAKSYLAKPNVRLQEYLDYYNQVKKDLVKLAKVITE